MRPIDADKFKNAIKAECNPYGKPTISYEDGCKVMEMIDQQPTILHCKDNTDKCLCIAIGLISEIMCRATVHNGTLTDDDMSYINERINELKIKCEELWREEADIKDHRDVVFRDSLLSSIDEI